MYRTVRRSESPAFRIFDQLFPRGGEYTIDLSHGLSQAREDRAGNMIPTRVFPQDNEIEALKAYLGTIPRQLQALFLAGKASPVDRDEFGSTLLEVC